jgi:hypothetical protein
MANPNIGQLGIATRFPKNRKDHTTKHPEGYLTSRLKKFLKKKIKYKDPETKKMVTGTVRDAIVWRYLLNARQGQNYAIEGIFDRIEGKLKAGNGNGNGTNITVNITLTSEERNVRIGRLQNFYGKRV